MRRSSLALGQPFFFALASDVTQKKACQVLQAKRFFSRANHQTDTSNDMERSASWVCRTSEAQFVIHRSQIETRTCKDPRAEERMTTNSLFKTSAKPVQTTPKNLRDTIHKLHSLFITARNSVHKSTLLSPDITHNLTQTVHKISAAITDAGIYFSAKSTVPTTTTTTFIYKKIEKEAL